MPLAIETSLGDSFFASDACDTRDPKSGCYNLTSAFDVKARIDCRTDCATAVR